MDQLPAMNAALNAISTLLLVSGYRFIRAKNISWHRASMISAFVCSMLFLVGYIAHKVHLYQSTGSWNTTFAGEGAVRVLYLTLLASHVLLAMTVPVLASITLFRGLRMQVATHKRIARITYPIWMYVSVTGVLVYFMLYQWFPSS